MNIYRNIGGASSVSRFETGDDFIVVIFECDSAQYLYDYVKPGKHHVEKMKRFAKLGQGLNSYILRYVGQNYSKKM